MHLSLRTAFRVSTIVFALAIGVQDADARQKRLQMQSMFTTRLPVIGDAAKTVAAEIDQRSGKQVSIRIYEPGALVPRYRYIDAVSFGTLDMAWGSPGTFNGRIPAAALFSSVPFGMDPRRHVAWLSTIEAQTHYREIYKTFNVTAMPCAIFGMEAAGWFLKPIETIEDLRGIRMRTFGLSAKVLEKVGVATSVASPADIYIALSSGALDAAEMSTPYIDFRLGFNQVAGQYHYPGWHQPSTMIDLVINQDIWDGFTADVRQVVKDTCVENLERSIARDEKLTREALSAIKDGGINITPFPAPVLAELREKWDEVALEMSRDDPLFAAVLQSYQRFAATTE